MPDARLIIIGTILYLILIIRVRGWNADTAWDRYAQRLRDEGIIAVRPATWNQRHQRNKWIVIVFVPVFFIVLRLWAYVISGV